MKRNNALLISLSFILFSCGENITSSISHITSSEDSSISETSSFSEESSLSSSSEVSSINSSEEISSEESISTVEKVNATFLNYDGTTLYETTVEKGTTPVYDGPSLIRESDAQYAYTFSDWKPKLGNIFTDTVFKAQYSSELREYEIKFINENGEVLQTENLKYGEVPSYKGETPTKAEDAYYRYTFSGWDKEITSVTKSTTYVAQYQTNDVCTYTIGDEYCWDIALNQDGSRSFTSTSENAQMLLLNDLQFESGTIEFKMKYGEGVEKFTCASGIVFGADSTEVGHSTGKWICTGMDPWNDFVTFSKDNGAFRWEDSNKIPACFTDKNYEYSMKFSYDKSNKQIHYFFNGEYVCTTYITLDSDGKYIGIYADKKDLTISDIKISDEVYTPEQVFSYGAKSNWNINNESNSYTSTSNGIFLMLPKYKITSSCYVEYDILLHDDSTYYYCGSGLVLSNIAAPSHNFGSFLVVGRDWWGGYDTFQKINGGFAWKDTNKIPNAMPNYNQTYHLKFYFDIINKTLTYYFGDQTSTQPFDLEFSTYYVGLYVDGLTTFSNISIHS